VRKALTVTLACGLLASPATFAGVNDYAVVAPESRPLTAGLVTARVETSISGPEKGVAWARVFLHNEDGRPVSVAVRYEGDEVQVDRQVELGPLERRTVIIPLPEGLNAGRAVLAVPQFPLASTGFFVSRGREPFIGALASEQTLSRALGKGPLGAEQAGSDSVTFRVVHLERAQLPVELLAYQGLDALYLGDVALEELDEARRRAVEAYLATGGRVALGRCTPGTLAYLPLLPPVSPQNGRVPYGFGELLWCNASIAQLAGFLGRVPEWVALPRTSSKSITLEGGAALLPEVAPPVGRFFFIVLAFGLAVGPGSFWVARRRGSALLLVTIPLTAVVTSAIIILSAFLGDGLATRASTRSLTLLDRRQGRAVSIGIGGFFSGVTPGDLSVGNVSTWAFQPSSLSLREGALLRRGFIPPRRCIEWSLASVVPTRARVTLRQAGERIRVQNALGAAVREIYVRRGQRLYVARALADGEEGTATACHPAEAIHVENWPVHARARSLMTAPLQEGEFLAVVQGAPFLPVGDLALQHRGSEALVRGEIAP
jgi:hypothetical protein